MSPLLSLLPVVCPGVVPSFAHRRLAVPFEEEDDDHAADEDDVEYLTSRRGVTSWWLGDKYAFASSFVGVSRLFDASVIRGEDEQEEEVRLGHWVAVGK